MSTAKERQHSRLSPRRNLYILRSSPTHESSSEAPDFAESAVNLERPFRHSTIREAAYSQTLTVDKPSGFRGIDRVADSYCF